MATILIVDDDKDFTDEASRLLVDKGYKVHTASNREDGMAAAVNLKPDLLILDTIIGQADFGLSMPHDLRDAGVTTPILMLNSLGKITGMKYAKDDDVLPVDEILEKPIKRDKLLSTIENLITKS